MAVADGRWRVQRPAVQLGAASAKAAPPRPNPSARLWEPFEQAIVDAQARQAAGRELGRQLAAVHHQSAATALLPALLVAHGALILLGPWQLDHHVQPLQPAGQQARQAAQDTQQARKEVHAARQGT